MTSHYDSVARAALVLGFALLAMPLLTGRSAVARRLVLTVAFAAVLVLPFVPVWHVKAPVVHDVVARLVAEPAVAAVNANANAYGMAGSSPSSVVRSIDWLAIAWSIGALLVAARFVLGLVFARRLVGRAAPSPVAWDSAIAIAEKTTGLRAEVKVSSEVEAPAVTGIFSPVVIVPTSSKTWSDERKLAVLLHELAHVAAYDLVVQVLASIVCSLHWFNPLAWLAARRLRLERELAADEAVLRAGMRASTYAGDLLAIAGAAPAGTIAIGEKPLPKRIAAIVAARRPVMLGTKGAAALVFGMGVVAMGAACSTTATAPESPAAQAASAPGAAPAHGDDLDHDHDHDLQLVAERELARAVSEWKAAGGTILVMSPQGRVLADAGGHSDRTYVTGSTMKSILLAAAIDEGVVSETDVFDCTNGDRNGKVLRDASPLGRVLLPELVDTSSNVGFAQIFDRLGGARYDRVLRRFHFATPPQLATTPSGDWAGAMLGIGGTMSATPRQVSRAYAALANGGDGIVEASTAARVTRLLEGVVASERGTGKKARVAGIRVAGKTGTSEWTEPSGTQMTYASFVGYLPAEQPRYVVFVGIESAARENAWGGEAAAPVFARVATQAITH
jgi:beta-lactamase regulating signal transducer with metallopeptidase domain